MPERKKIMAFAAALILVAAIFPQIASAWFVNQANVAITHAAARPTDSPQRSSDLSDAANALNQPLSWSNAERFLLARARVQLARGDAASASRTFDEAGAASRADPIAQFVWADAARQSNQTPNAIDHWRAASAYVYFSQQMHRAADAHQWKIAEDCARIAVSIDPNNADAHFILGDALSRQDINNAEALRELDRARELTHDPETLSTYLSRRGEVLATQGRLQEALPFFDQARAVAPIDARPRTDYALTLLQLQPDARTQMVALLEQVVSDSPWYTAAYIALANFSEATGDPKSAEYRLHGGLARNANNPELLFELGQFYARQHRFDEAKATYVLALKHETRADNLQSIARALEKLNGS